MKYQRILSNKNTIEGDTTCQKRETQQADSLTMRFVLSGSETCHVAHRQLAIHPDSFLILNGQTRFVSKIDALEPVQSCSLTFDHAFLTDFMQSYSRHDDDLLSNGVANTDEDNFNETLYPLKGDMRYTLQHLWHHANAGTSNDFLLNEYLHHTLLNYFRIYNEEIVEKERRLAILHHSTRTEILRRLNLAKEYMLGSFNEAITLDDIAGYACLSVNHLLRNFKQAFGVSPYQYLTSIRLQRARHLIKTTGMPINEIVHIIGFECPSSFIRLFKSRYHITPNKYKLVS